jgi:hypothetical protein
MPSVMSLARVSRAPRNTPGKASELLIWLGKLLRPVATTRACRPATSGWTSGSGLDRAKTVAPPAVEAVAVAVPSEMTATVLDTQVYSAASPGSSAMAVQTRATLGV